MPKRRPIPKPLLVRIEEAPFVFDQAANVAGTDAILRLPLPWLVYLDWSHGDEIEITQEQGRLVLRATGRQADPPLISREPDDGR